jgi:prepilin-type N-terminal cleavage/methylation domain-containing protein
MKTEFKAKFLQYVSNRKKEEGFTLIELLVVIIIIGILAAIALPSFLSQANKAKQSEAKQYLSSINKGQQAFYAEQGGFVGVVTEVDKLGLGIKTATNNYTYNIGSSSGFNGKAGAKAWTDKAGQGLRGYAGVVFLQTATGGDTSSSTLCENTTVAATYTFADATACTANAGWTDVK